MKKKIAVLGSTGSVGRQAIESVDRRDSDIVLLTGGRNISLLAEQARETRASVCAVPDKRLASELRTMLADTDTKVYGGEDAVCKCTEECGADVIVHSIAGMAGIPSALTASTTGSRLAIANKESVITVGDILFENIRKAGGELIPVDSEHSAVFQCLLTSGAIDPKGNSKPEKVKRILLTASGGPFFGKKKEELESVTPAMALAHPTWKMGHKITIDCATLMNKGFEIIEAARLFGTDPDKIEVIIHRQSIIHSMVEYIDNMVIAQLGVPDMKHCIRYAVSYPERMKVSEQGLDFFSLEKLTFDRPDSESFPLLNAARRAYSMGTTAPAALISADEEAVVAFLSGKIGFNSISEVVGETIERFSPHDICSVETVYDAENEGRIIARKEIAKYSTI